MKSLYRRVREQAASELSDLAGRDLTVEFLRQWVEGAADYLVSSSALRGQYLEPLSVEQIDELVKDLETMFNIWVDGPQIIDNNEDHVPWLHLRREDIEWRYWSRYRSYMQAQWGSPNSVDSLEDLTDKVLMRLESPDREGTWDRRGLVVGHVQSGKTANYTGLICKAVDAGYRLVIVLAGMHSNLRTQTQIRLDEGFLGYESFGAEQSRLPTGVGKIDRTLSPGSVTHRGDRGDFNKSFAKQFNVSHGHQPLLFVVKKNAHILRNLVEWVQGQPDVVVERDTGRKYLRGVPVLVIDDEADQASVNSAALEEQPKRINSLIRQLLYSFDQRAYVGYTATPFANIFISEAAFTEREGPDLFPASFIISLPTPTNYIGPARVFGLDGDEDRGIEPSPPLPLVRPADDGSEWLPQRHNKNFRPATKGEAVLPESLRESVMSFILAGAAKAARGLGTEHHSMLVHVTRFVKVQELVAVQIKDELTRIRRRVMWGDGEGGSIEEEFRDLWERDFAPTTASVSDALKGIDPFLTELAWSDVQRKIRETVEPMVVHLVNGLSVDSLQYEDHKDTGLKVIAVGGAKLSRGLTLEGLTTSYFLRSSRMYDTLMQMGRWFGYRPRYADLCRLYLPADIAEWYSLITEAGEELRHEFDYMTLIGGTPKDYGLRVRSHPSLLVTSQVRMRSGTRLRCSFTGQVSETVVFHREPEVIESNLAVTNALLDELGEPSKRKGGSRVWEAVPAARVLTFLRGYKSHPLSYKAHSKMLADFIQKQQDKRELVTWTVCLATNSTPQARPAVVGGQSIGLIKRSDLRLEVSRDGKMERLVIKKILNPADESIDLSPEEKSGHEPLTRKSIRDARPSSRGLLIIYPLDPAPEEGRDIGLRDLTTPVVGFAVSFPGIADAAAVEYIVDNTYYQQYYGDNDYSEEEDEDPS